jgi:hypothetical protein
MAPNYLWSQLDMCFDSTHLKQARERCGYLPSTRAALNDKKVRHEVIEAVDSDYDEDALSIEELDPVGSLYKIYEEQNHEAVLRLLSKGYLLATKLKMSLCCVEANQIAGRARVLTEPNTRERQDLLMGVSTAGGFFAVTNGGGPMNSNNAILAYARKKLKANAKELRKEKAAVNGIMSKHQRALTLLGDSRKPQHLWQSKWNVADLKSIIEWKQGPAPRAPYNDKLSGVKKGELQRLYDGKYRQLADPDPNSFWTGEKEAELCRCEDGIIDDFIEDTGLRNAIERDNEYLSTRVALLNADRQKKVLTDVLKGISSRTQRDNLLASLTTASLSINMNHSFLLNGESDEDDELHSDNEDERNGGAADDEDVDDDSDSLMSFD